VARLDLLTKLQSQFFELQGIIQLKTLSPSADIGGMGSDGVPSVEFASSV
jgi:hypothetical protein